MRRQLFSDPTTLKQLTPRESEVLNAAKNNKPLDDMADIFHIPETLVVRHLSNIITKLYETDKPLAHQLLFSYNLNIKN